MTDLYWRTRLAKLGWWSGGPIVVADREWRTLGSGTWVLGSKLRVAEIGWRT